jgi:hypothetical protein
VNERWSALFSAQLFNAFNTVQFADPSVSLQSPQSFGVLSSELNAPRILQLFRSVSRVKSFVSRGVSADGGGLAI